MSLAEYARNDKPGRQAAAAFTGMVGREGGREGGREEREGYRLEKDQNAYRHFLSPSIPPILPPLLPYLI